MPKSLGCFYTSGFYAWDSKAVSAVSASTSPEYAFFDFLHFFVIIEARSSVEDALEVFIDDEVKKKEIVVHPFDPQAYRGKKA